MLCVSAQFKFDETETNSLCESSCHCDGFRTCSPDGKCSGSFLKEEENENELEITENYNDIVSVRDELSESNRLKPVEFDSEEKNEDTPMKRGRGDHDYRWRKGVDLGKVGLIGGGDHDIKWRDDANSDEELMGGDDHDNWKKDATLGGDDHDNWQ